MPRATFFLYISNTTIIPNSLKIKSRNLNSWYVTSLPVLRSTSYQQLSETVGLGLIPNLSATGVSHCKLSL